MKDPNDIVKLEKAIAQKYGNQAIVNPKSLWDEQSETSYQQQLSGSFAEKEKKIVEEVKEGYSIQNTRLVIPECRICSKCGIFSLNARDSLYLNKFELCHRCFLKEEVFLKWEQKIK